MPDSFMRAEAQRLFDTKLPTVGKYAVGNIFSPKNDPHATAACKALLQRHAKQRGFVVLGWRPVPVDNSMLGKDPLDSEPATEQIFLLNGHDGEKMSQRDFERELMRVRKLTEDEATAPDFYVNSLTGQTITYKGQLTPEQVSQYFLDLRDETFVSHMALVHSRFSTNTFPSWERAQPIRMMCHNGEINTLRGNKNWMYSRGGLMSSEYFGDAGTVQMLPVTSDGAKYERRSNNGSYGGLEGLCHVSALATERVQVKDGKGTSEC